MVAQTVRNSVTFTICVQSYLIHIQSSFLYSVSSYFYSVNIYIFCLILFIFSQLVCIQSDMFSHMLHAFRSHFFCKHIQCAVRHVKNLIKICSFFKKRKE